MRDPQLRAAGAFTRVFQRYGASRRTIKDATGFASKRGHIELIAAPAALILL
jgi:hypothetical protein